MSKQAQSFPERGWCRFPAEARLASWVRGALPAARAALRDPAQQRWLRYQGTWFAGVNALPNAADGSVGDSGPLGGAALDFARALAGGEGVLDAAQVSVCFPGYPRPMAGESAARARFRRERDAAHVDGLLARGAARRRYPREYHAYILGIPMVEFDAGAAPFVVWEGSHEILRAAFADRLAGTDPAAWREQDVTEVYQRARQRCFERCRRVEVHALPGEAYVAHRLLLHGMAPWQPGARAGPDGRMICYFRPPSLSPREWLEAP